jgi:phosphate acetyltransferase
MQLLKIAIEGYLKLSSFEAEGMAPKMFQYSIQDKEKHRKHIVFCRRTLIEFYSSLETFVWMWLISLFWESKKRWAELGLALDFSKVK